MDFDKNKLDTLLRLIDEPEENLWFVIRDSILEFGKPIIGYLKEEYDNTFCFTSKSRLKGLIYELNLLEVKEEFLQWTQSIDYNVFDANVILEKALNPWLDLDALRVSFAKIRFDIWLDLNPTLSSLEKIGVLNNIFFHNFGFNKEIVDTDTRRCSMFSSMLDLRMGDNFGTAMIYYSLAVANKLPLKIMPLTHDSYILCYMNSENEVPYVSENEVLFFISPGFSGQTIGRKSIFDIINSFNSKHITFDSLLLDDKTIISTQITHLIDHFRVNKMPNKQDILRDLSSMLL